jgi:hypothetical protein
MKVFIDKTNEPGTIIAILIFWALTLLFNLIGWV